MREITFRPRAQLDIESIYIFLAMNARALRAAQDTIGEIYAAVDRVAEFPESGVLYSEKSLEQSYRRVLVSNYWIYYTYDDRVLTVWRVFHSKRDIDSLTIVDF